MDGIENPYRWPMRGWFVATVIGALGLAVMTVPRYPNLLVSNGLFAVGITASASILLVLGLPCLAYVLWRAYGAKKEIAAFVAASNLLHWSYASDEWRRFVEAEWGRAKAKIWRVPIIILCLCLVMGLTIFLVLLLFLLVGIVDVPIAHQIPLGNVLFVFGSEDLLIMGMVGAILGVVFGVEEQLKEKERYRRGLKSPGEAYLGDRGFFMTGIYVPLHRRSRLSSPGIETGDLPTLRLSIEVPLPQGYRPIGQVRVPIPRGKEGEALELVERLSAQPYGRMTQDKPWSLRNLGFFLFLVLNLGMVQFYVQLPGFISPHARWGRQFWLLSLLFASMLLWWPTSTRFLRRMTVLGSVCFGLIAAVLQFGPPAHIKHLAAATIAVGSLAQITSIVLFALEIRAWKGQAQ